MAQKNERENKCKIKQVRTDDRRSLDLTFSFHLIEAIFLVLKSELGVISQETIDWALKRFLLKKKPINHMSLDDNSLPSSRICGLTKQLLQETADNHSFLSSFSLLRKECPPVLLMMKLFGPTDAIFSLRMCGLTVDRLHDSDVHQDEDRPSVRTFKRKCRWLDLGLNNQPVAPKRQLVDYKPKIYEPPVLLTILFHIVGT